MCDFPRALTVGFMPQMPQPASLQLAVGTDVLPSFTSPPPTAARGVRIGSRKSDQAEVLVLTAAAVRCLLETRPRGLQELGPLSSTECESKTLTTHTHTQAHTCVCTCICAHTHTPLIQVHAETVIGRQVQGTHTPVPTNHHPSKWSALTSPTHQEALSSNHCCSEVGETWAGVLALSLCWLGAFHKGFTLSGPQSPWLLKLR